MTSAYVQFSVDEAVNTPCNLNIYGQASDNAATFIETDFDISSRPRTNASVSWLPQEWLTVGAAGAEQQTPDLARHPGNCQPKAAMQVQQRRALIMEVQDADSTESFEQLAQWSAGAMRGVPLCHTGRQPGSTEHRARAE